jgi:hypothetical protein
MTYEQAGGPAGGLAAVTDNGDTLTLTDRALHHFTTGISTVEAASKNAGRLLNEFQKYFADASKGVGEYKAYILKMGLNDEGKFRALMQLLDRNGIHYYAARSANLRGLNYETLKEENFSIGERDLVVPSTQPKGALVKVLFEQNTHLSDSATYDITAWSLPYAYGLQAYAAKAPVNGLSNYVVTDVFNKEDGSPYAYVIPWTSIQSARLAARLLQKGLRLRFATQPFTANNQTFNPGSVLVIGTANRQVPDLWTLLRTEANAVGVQIVPVGSGFVDKGLDFGSSSVIPMKARKLAMLTGEGVNSGAAGEVWYYFEQVLDYPVTLINANDAARINWNDYDVVIMPDGNYRFLSDKAASDALKTWISNGGHLIAMEGGVSGLAKLDWAIKTKKMEDTNTKDKDEYENLRRYNERERDALKDFTPGSIYKVELDNSHPLAYGYPAYYHSLKLDNNQYEFFKGEGWNVGVVKKGGPVSGFVGNNLNKRLQNHLVLGVQDIGRGHVTYFTDDVLFRSFWENGKLLFANAVFLVGQ